MKSLIFFIRNGTLNVGGTRYHGPGNTADTPSNTEGVRMAPIPAACTVRNMKVVYATGGPDAGKSILFTVRKFTAGSWSSTSVAATLSDTATSADSGANSATFAAGDLIAIQTVPTGTPTARICKVSLEIEADTATSQIILGHVAAIGTTQATRFFNPQDGTVFSSSDTDVENRIATGGTIGTLYMQLSTAPGSGSTRNFLFYQDGSDSSVNVSFSDADVQKSDTSDSLTVVSGTRYAFKYTGGGNAPVDTTIAYGYVFTPTVAGETIYGVNFGGTATAVRYGHLAWGADASTATEANTQSPLTADATWKKLGVWLSAAPGAGKSWAIIARKNTANATQTVTLSDAETSESDSSNTDALVSTDMANWRVTPTSTPDNARLFIACVFFTDPGGGGGGDLLLRMMGEGLFVGSN